MANGHRSQIKREKETLLRIQDQAQSYLTLEYLFRRLVSY